MVVKVHCGTVLGDEFAAMLKICPPKQSHNALCQPSLAGLPRNEYVAESASNKMKRILCSDWLPERARWAHLDRALEISRVGPARKSSLSI